MDSLKSSAEQHPHDPIAAFISSPNAHIDLAPLRVRAMLVSERHFYPEKLNTE